MNANSSMEMYSMALVAFLLKPESLDQLLQSGVLSDATKERGWGVSQLLKSGPG